MKIKQLEIKIKAALQQLQNINLLEAWDSMAAAFSCDNQLLLTAMVTGLPKFVDLDLLTAMSVDFVHL